jgi:signal transduction histidine kinase
MARKSRNPSSGSTFDNGVKYAGRVDVLLRPGPAQGVAIVVRDDGPGIPDGERERVFEPFYRMDRARTADKGGMGLGLAITRSIVGAHGGRITLADAVPQGLAATIELPGS